ncbi:MAG: hypothetical protein U9N06_03235 [candidate division WOR-3 bacterium]|nr:hypothetical protein [candidate division WOR-3 bacterium]
MSVAVQKIRRLIKVVTLDGMKFTGELSGRNDRGLFLKVRTPMGDNRSVFVSHNAISHLEIEGWQ